MGTRVYVGRISYDVRERDIEKFFKGYGRIREVLMKDGFAFVEFDDHRDADDAVYELNGKELMGERVHVEFARGPSRGRGRFRTYGDRGSSRGGGGGGGDRGGGYYSRDRPSGGLTYGPPRNTEYRVIVENLSSRVSWQDLKDFMRQAGEVTYADAHKRERNMGIVDFATYTDMKNAIEKLDGTDLHGRRIKLLEDKSRRRSRSRSRSRSTRRSSKSRSRSKSHSRSRSPRSKSRSRSKSRDRSKSPVTRNNNKDVSKSRSRSRSKSPNAKRSRTRSPSRERSKSHSRSRSATPEKNNDRSPNDDRSMDGE